MADDLIGEASSLEDAMHALEAEHRDFLDKLNEPWNELRSIAGLPPGDLRATD